MKRASIVAVIVRAMVVGLLGSIWSVETHATSNQIYLNLLSECRLSRFQHFDGFGKFFAEKIEKIVSDIPHFKLKDGSTPSQEYIEDASTFLRSQLRQLISEVEDRVEIADGKLRSTVLDRIAAKQALDVSKGLSSENRPFDCKVWLERIAYADLYLASNQALYLQLLILLKNAENRVYKMLADKGWG